MKFNFCGGTYQAQSSNVDAEECINFIPEKSETANAKTPLALMNSPGLKIFAAIPDGLVGGQKWVPHLRRYFVFGSALYEVSSTGVVTNRGPLAANVGHCSAVINSTQMLIRADGKLYFYDFTTNNPPVQVGPTPVTQLAYSDGFAIALFRNSKTLRLSKISDFSSWSALNSADVSLFPDNIVSMIVSQRGIALMGNTASTVYENSGAPIFPFVPVNGVYIEQGSASAYAPVKLDNSVFWVAYDERGSLVAYRSQGYQGIRVSTHAVESAWRSYPTGADILGYSYQENGHPFWMLYFPAGNIHWCYDVSTQLWHKRGFWKNGAYEAHHSWNHSFAYEKHLVGDWGSGTIYEMSSNFLDDAGAPIRRLRRSPYVSDERQWISHAHIQFDVETGLGPIPGIPSAFDGPSNLLLQASDASLWTITLDDTGTATGTATDFGTAEQVVLNDPDDTSASWLLGADVTGQLTATAQPYDSSHRNIFYIATSGGLQGGLTITSVDGSTGRVESIIPVQSYRDPQLMLRWSDDDARKWSNTYFLNCGQAGQYKKRVIKRRLGASRSRVYEVVVTDPIAWRFADAYLQVQGERKFA